jgi:hypothetical protein
MRDVGFAQHTAVLRNRSVQPIIITTIAAAEGRA